MTEEYFVVWNEDRSIQLTCDECGHVNHWGERIEFDEIAAHVESHHIEAHNG